MVCDEATTIVGETPAVASAKSTPSPETELRATEELEYSAARTKQSGYERDRESMESSKSEDVNRWR